MTRGQVCRKRAAVVVFTRPPELDARGKHLPHLEHFFRQMAERTLVAALRCPGADVVVVGCLGAGEIPRGAIHLPQRGASAPVRFVNALEDTARLGYERVVAVGTDVPGLRPGTLRAALDHLDEGAELVLGPAADGGAYLIGVRSNVISSLVGMPWGTADVLESLCASTPRVALLDEELDDVDNERGLRKLVACHALPRQLAGLVRALEAGVSPPPRERDTSRSGNSSATLRPVSRRGPPESRPVAVLLCA